MRFEKSGWTKSLGFKILIAHAVGVVVSVVLVFLAAYWLMFVQGGYFAGEDVEKLTEDMAENIEFNEGGVPTRFNEQLGRFTWLFDSLKSEVAFRISDSAETGIRYSPAGKSIWANVDPVHQTEPGQFNFSFEGISFYGATVPIKAPTSDHIQTWYFQFAISERLHFLLHQGIALPMMAIAVITFSMVIIVVFGLTSFLTLKYMLRRLRVVSESAAAISPTSLHERMRIEGVPTELRPLVKSFNQALDRLEQGFHVQRDFLATAAHELKTPLSLIRAQIEMSADQKLRETLLADINHMSRQVQQLLLLAEVSEVQNYSPEKTDVGAVTAETVSFLRPLIDGAGLTVTLQCLAPAYWTCDRSALFTLLKNLIENAVQHSPHGERLFIIVSQNLISVRDWGPGMEEKELSKIFDRFWKGLDRRDVGAGLGLAICSEISHAHGWELTVERSEPGLRFTIYTETTV